MAKKSVDKMTKAELLREVKRLQKQYDKLLDQLAKEQARGAFIEDKPRSTLGDAGECTTPPAPHKFPWEAALPNSFEGAR